MKIIFVDTTTSFGIFKTGSGHLMTESMSPSGYEILKLKKKKKTGLRTKIRSFHFHLPTRKKKKKLKSPTWQMRKKKSIKNEVIIFMD